MVCELGITSYAINPTRNVVRGCGRVVAEKSDQSKTGGEEPKGRAHSVSGDQGADGVKAESQDGGRLDTNTGG